MTEKVTLVIDTNSCRSEAGKHDHFFGYREELGKLKASAKIVIPRIVIDEISAQKRRALKRKKDEHISNPFLQISGLNPDDIIKIDINQIISQLLDSEITDFTVKDLKKSALALEKIRNWAVEKRPPFSPDEKAGDKGFKDAYIVCIIDELLEELEDEYIVFITKDDLLKQAFEDKPRVKVISQFNEAAKYIIDAFIDDYMVNKIREELDIQDFTLVDSWQNIEENWVIQVSVEENLKLIVIDSAAREILDNYDGDVGFFVQMLTDSISFEQTHNGVHELTLLLPFLRMGELEKLMIAAVTNDQVYRIAKDDDVKQFYALVYEAAANRLDTAINEEFKEYFM